MQHGLISVWGLCPFAKGFAYSPKGEPAESVNIVGI